MKKYTGGEEENSRENKIIKLVLVSQGTRARSRAG